MVLTKEYRVCMPLLVEEYRIGQLYMIARHSFEQSDGGEGVEVVDNKECEDPIHGKGRYTEKHIHLSSRLPYWVQSITPKWFYIIEKAWNYYPFTITEYTCSFLPKFSISILTKYENNNGSNDNCFDLTEEQLANKTVDFVDIAYDELNAKHYKDEEDPKFFQSEKTGRGPLVEGWRDREGSIMCSYKLVHASFEVWGLQTRVEEFTHKCIRDILLLGHRQAFTWIDTWFDMTIDDVRKYEENMQAETNKKLLIALNGQADGGGDSNSSPIVTEGSSTPHSRTSLSPKSPKTPNQNKSWFQWP